MTTNAVPAVAVRRLLETHLDTFEKLELVLALRRAAVPVLLAKLGDSILLDLEGTRRVIVELVRSGVVVRGERDTVALVSTFQPEVVSELARIYDEDRVLVVTTLSQIAMTRIRGMAASTFADAFRINRKKPDGDG